jgi:hypothetical protein
MFGDWRDAPMFRERAERCARLARLTSNPAVAERLTRLVLIYTEKAKEIEAEQPGE